MDYTLNYWKEMFCRDEDSSCNREKNQEKKNQGGVEEVKREIKGK